MYVYDMSSRVLINRKPPQAPQVEEPHDQWAPGLALQSVATAVVPARGQDFCRQIEQQILATWC